MKLTPRDIKIFSFLRESQFATIRQIARRFWAGMNWQYGGAKIRLNTLEKNKYLRKQIIDFNQDQILVLPTKQSNQALFERGLIQANRLDDFIYGTYSGALKHDLLVTDIRQAIEDTLDIKEWITDHDLRLLRGNTGLNSRSPDGLFRAFYAGKEFNAVLEFERSRYSRDKFYRVVNRIFRQQPDHYIFFVTETPERVQSLLSFCEERQNLYSKKILLSSLAKVLKKGVRAIWLNPIGDKISFDVLNIHSNN